MKPCITWIVYYPDQAHATNAATKDRGLLSPQCAGSYFMKAPKSHQRKKLLTQYFLTTATLTELCPVDKLVSDPVRNF
jgi:hypothetical protein